jgi:hypothetical protein
LKLEPEDAIEGDDWDGGLEPKEVVPLMERTPWSTTEGRPHFPEVLFELTKAD